jgi:hypothetical protein
LDYINGREVAALVYQRNKHIINLFIFPSEAGRTEVVQSFEKDGYNCIGIAMDSNSGPSLT